MYKYIVNTHTYICVYVCVFIGLYISKRVYFLLYISRFKIKRKTYVYIYRINMHRSFPHFTNFTSFLNN